MTEKFNPEDIAKGAMDRVCSLDINDPDATFDDTAERVAAFLNVFILEVAARLHQIAVKEYQEGALDKINKTIEEFKNQNAS